MVCEHHGGVRVFSGVDLNAPRVLHVTHSTNTGLAHCLGDWIRTQRAAGWSVEVASPGGTVAERVDQEGGTNVRWQASRSPTGALPREARALSRIIDDARPDLVHLHCGKAGVLGRALLRGRLPTVYSPHAWPYLGVGGALRRATLQWERLAARWAAAVVCVSESERRTGEADGIRARFVVLPNEVDLSDFADVTVEDPAAIRTDLGVPHDVLLAVCVARLARQKGQDVLLRAWPRVRGALPSAQLVIVGDGPDRASVEAAAAGATGVRVIGAAPRRSALRWMRASNVVVAPSRWEGMSLVPLEARALGRPVVAAQVDGVAEAIAAGADVTVVPVEDADALGDALVAVLGRPPRSERVPSSRPARRSSAQQLVDLYESLVPARGATA